MKCCTRAYILPVTLFNVSGLMVRGGGCTDLYSATAQSLDLLSDPTLAPPGAWGCESLQALPGWWRNWSNELASKLTTPQSNTTSLAHVSIPKSFQPELSDGPDLGADDQDTIRHLEYVRISIHTAHGSHINYYHFELDGILAFHVIFSIPGCLWI